MEIWKDIPKYEGIYQISNQGNIKSLKFGEKILKCSPTNGYNRVLLYKDNKVKGFRVHRLVANAFIPNPNNKPEVNHIDGDSFNNNVNNLEWATNKENIFHSRNISRNGAVISVKSVLKIYNDHPELSLQAFVKEILNSAN